MTAGKQENRTRAMTDSVSIAQRGFVNEWRENSRIRQALVHGGAVCRPSIKAAQSARTISGAAPVWLAVLAAARCQAVANGRNRVIRWDWALGRALYTNRSATTEFIRPMGVQLQAGETLAVSWMAGETAYKLEIFNHKPLPQLGRGKALMH
jgi:hypothetical protein